MQTSKNGNSALTKSPRMISSLRCSGLRMHETSISHGHLIEPQLNRAETHFPCTRFVTSLAIRGSISTATTLRTCSRILTVKLPVPGPTSRTTSVGFKLAYRSKRVWGQSSQSYVGKWEPGSAVERTLSTILRRYKIRPGQPCRLIYVSDTALTPEPPTGSPKYADQTFPC